MGKPSKKPRREAPGALLALRAVTASSKRGRQVTQRRTVTTDCYPKLGPNRGCIPSSNPDDTAELILDLGSRD
jgi:hypothetical protein